MVDLDIVCFAHAPIAMGNIIRSHNQTLETAQHSYIFTTREGICENLHVIKITCYIATVCILFQIIYASSTRAPPDTH